MRTVRLGRTFDAVFVHDAVDYMTSEDDLRHVIETAFVHCRPLPAPRPRRLGPGRARDPSSGAVLP